MSSVDEARSTRPMPAPSSSSGASEDTQRWIDALEQLNASFSASTSQSRWTIEWAIHRWANEVLSESTAIRIGESEGLSGPAPATWRILAHIDGDAGACSLAILPGRAARSTANVLAASLRDHCGRTVIAARDSGLHWLIGEAPRDVDGAQSRLEQLIDALSSGQLEERPDLPLDLELAFALTRDEALRPRVVVERSA